MLITFFGQNKLAVIIQKMAKFIGKFAGRSTNMQPYWSVIERIIYESDVVLEILDARFVQLSRNEKVEELIEKIKRPMIFVINKSDLVDKDRLKTQMKALERKSPIVFVSNKNKFSYKILLYNIRKVFKEYGKREATVKPKLRETKADIVVGVLGYPNVGKSSIINGLAHKKKVQVSKKAGTTHGMHWIKINEEIKLIDSPGVIPLQKEDEVRYGLIGAKDRERLRHPDIVANAVIKLFMKENKIEFERHFNILVEKDEENDFDSIVNKIGERRRYLLKGGIVDENRVYADIVKEWQSGELRL